jgi:hypothetical protein
MTDTINTPTELGDAMRNGVEVQRHDREEHKVIEIRRGNGPIVKEPNPYYAGHTYKVPVIYVLDDGTEEETRETCRLLRDAKAFDATLPCAPRNPMKLRWMTLHTRNGGDGERLTWMSETSFYIGPS